MVRRHPGQLQSPYGLLPLSRVKNITAVKNTTGLELNYTEKLSEPGGPPQDEKLIGIYSSENDAQEAIKRIKTKPGFRDFPDGFQIDEYEIGKDNWPEGFVTVTSQ